MKFKTPVLLSYAFRPFFLIGGIFAILAIFAWIMTLHAKGLPGVTLLWHNHEMLIGFAMAAVAGFSLTAVANWTGRPAITGAPLGWLILSWLAGRTAMLFSGWLPANLVFLLDMLFPVFLGVLLGREIVDNSDVVEEMQQLAKVKYRERERQRQRQRQRQDRQKQGIENKELKYIIINNI